MGCSRTFSRRPRRAFSQIYRKKARSFGQLRKLEALATLCASSQRGSVRKSAGSRGVASSDLKSVLANIQKESAELRAITEIGSVGDSLRQLPTRVREEISRKPSGC